MHSHSNTHFITIDTLDNRQVPTFKKCLHDTIKIYHKRGFEVTSILSDNEFTPLKPEFPSLNPCAAGEHIPGMERTIRTIKDSIRSTYRMLPFRRLPRILLSYLARNAVFWLNSFPAADGISSLLSPRYIVLGKNIIYDKHIRQEFGSYVQTHKEHNNGMPERMIGAICMGPSGNMQGGHNFMSLVTGQKIH